MPLIAEFQWTKEIEDRLLAPIGTLWLAIEKVLFGMIQALVAGLIVLPLGWLLLRPIDISIHDATYVCRYHHSGRRIFRLRRPGLGLHA